jgi:aspartate 1-decarboxylase
MTFRTLVRSKLYPLHVTSLEAQEESLPGSIVLCSRLLWSAGLAELEQVEVLSLTNGYRMTATVLLGELGEVRIPGGEFFGFEQWASVVVTANVGVPSHRIALHRATLVQVDPRRNAALEICRQEVRPVLREPSFNPPPPRVVIREPILQP